MKSDLSDFEIFLTDNWDGENAQAISSQTLSVARKLIESVCEDFGLPDACPSVTGAIGLVYKFDDSYLYITIRSPKTAMFYHRSSQNISEDKFIEGCCSNNLVKALIAKLQSAKRVKNQNIHAANMNQTLGILSYFNMPPTYLWEFRNTW